MFCFVFLLFHLNCLVDILLNERAIKRVPLTCICELLFVMYSLCGDDDSLSSG